MKDLTSDFDPGQRWQPLFADEEKATTLAAIAEMVTDLCRFFNDRSSPQEVFPVNAVELSLGSGHAGLALLFAELAEAVPGTVSDEEGGRFLTQALHHLADVHLVPSLFYGYPGVAWLVDYLERRNIIDCDPDANDEIDRVLVDTLADPPGDMAAHDLVLGLLGLGVYALERFPRGHSEEIVNGLLDRLTATAIRTSEGLCWRTLPEQLPACDRHFTKGYYSTGVAHGVAGVIGFLGGCCRSEAFRARAEPLLEGAVGWLLAQSSPLENGVNFPLLVGNGTPYRPAPQAWCHGDPGIATVLFRAARRAGRADWEARAIELAARTAGYRSEAAAKGDPGFCHGSAGRGHLFNRLHQATGEPIFGDAARFWLRQSLAVRTPGCGLAGYSGQLLPNGELDRGLYRSAPAAPGLRCGVSGVALALLAAVGSQEPTWDSLFLF